MHSESSQPEPVAGADPLTHFLSPPPAPCQGEPLVEGKEGKTREGEKSEAKKGEKKRGEEKKRKRKKELLKAQGPRREAGGKPGISELFEVWHGSQHTSQP